MTLPEAEASEADDRRPMLQDLFKATPLKAITAPIKEEWDRFAAVAAPSKGGPTALKKGKHFGRYVILDELGRGGMGVVYRAYDSALERTVALKLYGRELAAESETTLERFYQEARATARLGHRGVVRIHDVGREGDMPFLSMDLVHGESFEELLRRIPLRQRLVHIVQVAQALEHAHAHGIVHRDVKPSNIIVDRQGQAVLVDFGVARDLARQTRLTRTGCIVGTVVRMSPEQVRAEPDSIGPMSDVWALGVLLYEAVCDEVPFEGSAAEVLVAILQRDLTWPETLSPRFPKLEAIVERCLEKDPDSRIQSAGELASDLADFLSGNPAAARPQKNKKAPTRVRSPAPHLRSSESGSRTSSAARRSRGAPPGPLRWVAAATLVLGVTALLLWPAPRDSPPVAAAAPPSAQVTPEVDARPPVAVAIDATPPEIELFGEIELPSADRVRSIQGRVRDGSRVQLWLDEELVPVSKDGSFTLEAELPGDGLHSLELVARDDAGNEARQELRLRLDTTPPRLRVLSPGAAPISSAAVTLQGVVEAGDLDRLMVDGRPVVPSEDGTFDTLVEFESEGAVEVVLEAHDRAGNHARLTWRVTYDATAPTLILDTPKDGALTRATHVTLRGRASDANLQREVRIHSAGPTVEVAKIDSDGRFALEVSLPEGHSTLEVECRDQAGHSTRERRSVVRDSRAPVVTLTRELPQELFGTRSRHLALVGSVDDPHASLTIGGKPVKLSSKGRFRRRMRLSEGANTVEIVALDLAGNRSELTRVVNYAKRRPTHASTQVLFHETFSKASDRPSDSGTLHEPGIIRSTPNERVFATQIRLADYQRQVVTLVPGAKLRLRYRLSEATQGSFKLQFWCPALKDNLSLFLPLPPDLGWQETEVDLDRLQTGEPLRPVKNVPHTCSSIQFLVGRPGEPIVFEIDDLLIHAPADTD